MGARPGQIFPLVFTFKETATSREGQERGECVICLTKELQRPSSGLGGGEMAPFLFYKEKTSRPPGSLDDGLAFCTTTGCAGGTGPRCIHVYVHKQKMMLSCVDIYCVGTRNSSSSEMRMETSGTWGPDVRRQDFCVVGTICIK